MRGTEPMTVPIAAIDAGASTFTRFRRSLTSRDWRSLGGMESVIIPLQVIGFGVLFGLVVPKHYHLGGAHPVFSAGVGMLAYTFGLRHAFDADHIAAVDNTTRKLLADNAERRQSGVPAAGFSRPISGGVWVSL